MRAARASSWSSRLAEEARRGTAGCVGTVLRDRETSREPARDRAARLQERKSERSFSPRVTEGARRPDQFTLQKREREELAKTLNRRPWASCLPLSQALAPEEALFPVPTRRKRGKLRRLFCKQDPAPRLMGRGHA